ncbi:MAG TPA: FG-GAP-like repeat-containing protein [Polyangiaceae bacterium]
MVRIVGAVVSLSCIACRAGDASQADPTEGIGAAGATTSRTNSTGAVPNSGRADAGAGASGAPNPGHSGGARSSDASNGGATSGVGSTEANGGSIGMTDAGGMTSAAGLNSSGGTVSAAAGRTSTSYNGGSPNPSVAGSTLTPSPGGRGGAFTGAGGNSIPTAGTSGGKACDPARESCPCDAGQLRCDGVCIDPKTDAAHCGATLECSNPTGTVGVDCRPLNSICTAYTCMACGTGEVACENRCLNPNTDNTYCGAKPGCAPSTGTRGDRCWGAERCLAAACVECLTFTSKGSARLGDNVQQLGIADVNDDNLLDIVTVLESDAEIVVFPGDGTGTIGTAQRQPFGTGPVGLALARLNSDAFVDAVIGDYTAGVVRIANGQGTGTFTEAQSIAVAGKPTRIVLCHIDNDTSLDAFVVEYGVNQVELLLGNGDGTFRLAPPIALPSAVAALAAGDINGDGRLDAVVAGNAEPMFILLGDGAGGFTVTLHDIEGYTRDMALADLNGDGKLDVLSAHMLTYNTNITLGKGDGTFETAQRLMIGSASLRGESVAATDLNADGLLDVVVGMDKGIYVVWGSGSWGNYTQNQTTLDAYTDASWLTIADIDSSGTPDIISRGNNWTVREYLGKVPDTCR